MGSNFTIFDEALCGFVHLLLASRGRAAAISPHTLQTIQNRNKLINIQHADTSECATDDAYLSSPSRMKLREWWHQRNDVVFNTDASFSLDQYYLGSPFATPTPEKITLEVICGVFSAVINEKETYKGSELGCGLLFLYRCLARGHGMKKKIVCSLPYPPSYSPEPPAPPKNSKSGQKLVPGAPGPPRGGDKKKTTITPGFRFPQGFNIG